MTSYWLTYKPLSLSAPRGWPAAEMQALVRQFETDPASATPLWRIASHKAAQTGDRVYLFKQGGNPKGIFGIGELMEPPRLQDDPTDGSGGLQHRAKIRFQQLVDPSEAFLLDYEAIQSILPESLVAAQASGTKVPEDVALELERRLASRPLPPLGSQQADDITFDPDSVHDERERALRAIRVRRGQQAFRTALLDAYGKRCAVTGCPVEDVLEAAHITRHLGPLTNHVSNGLLLRADLHTLFDCDLLAFEPAGRTIVLADSLQGTSYAKLAGKVLQTPKNAAQSPSRRNLEKRYIDFMAVIKAIEGRAAA